MLARRHASVAILRERVTWRRRIFPAQTLSADIVREIASSESNPDALTPSPRRTILEKASMTRKPLRVGRATRRRQLFVPRSSAAYTCCHRPRGRRPRRCGAGDVVSTTASALDANSRPLVCSNLRAKSSSFEIHVERNRIQKVARTIDLLPKIGVSSSISVIGLSLTVP